MGLIENALSWRGDDVSSMLDEIVKLPTYATLKVGEFEFQLKIGEAGGLKRRCINVVDYGNGYSLDYIEVCDSVYEVIYDNNKAVLAYNYTYYNIKDEGYYNNGKLSHRRTWSYPTIVSTSRDRTTWSIKFIYTKTYENILSSGEIEITTEELSQQYGLNLFPFYSVLDEIITTLSDEELIDFSCRLQDTLLT